MGYSRKDIGAALNDATGVDHPGVMERVSPDKLAACLDDIEGTLDKGKEPAQRGR